MRSSLRCFVAALVLAPAVAGQSLGELAQKEKARRDQVGQTPRVITNTEAARYRGGAVTTGTSGTGSARSAASARPAAPSAAGAAPKTAASESTGEPVDFEGRTESFWRQSFADARARVTQLESDSKVLVLRFNDLQNRFFRENDGFQQQELQRQINKTIYEQDLTRENLAKARAQVEQLEREARRSGALPGWIEARP